MMVCIAFALWPAQDAGGKIRHPWSGFDVGSQILVETSVSEDGVVKSKEKKIHTIVEAAEDHVDVSILDGVGRNEIVRIPLKLAHEGAEIVEKGTETLEAAGRSWECTVTEFALDGRTIASWLSAESPDGLVKMVVKSGADETVTVLEETDREADIGGTKVMCWVTRSTSGTRTIARWQSHDVPGFNVRVETVEEKDGVRTTTTERVVSFRSK